MAKKYIDAERFVDYFGDWYTEEGTELGYVGPIKDLVFRMPAADVAEVVRCCKCIYWDRYTIRHQGNDFRDWNEAECLVLAERDGYNEINRYTEADDFCSRGERKDG